MNNNNDPIKDHKRYYYQIPTNIAFLAISILFTLMVQRYEHQIGGGIGRPLLFLLINLEIFIAILLAASIIRQSVILFLERRQDRPGSVFKKNLLFSFIFLSILPGIFIFLGASKLVVKHIDLWFGARIEQGLASGITAYQETTATLRANLAQAGTTAAQEYEANQTLPSTVGGFETHWWPKQANKFNLAKEVALWRSYRELNDRPIKKLKAEFFKLFWSTASNGTTLIDFFGSTYWLKAYPAGMLAVVYRPPAPLRSTLIKIQNAHADYMNVREVKHVLKFNFYLQAILLLFLVLVLAIWCSFYLARGISEPIEQLLEATNEVRAGNLQVQVQVTGSRDLQALAISFNEMTKALEASHAALEEKNKELLSHVIKINTFKTWQEAVKQIAHEIKNPLTPIQLTTQRLQRKCLTTLPDDTGAIFNDGCSMILDQVQVIKNLVAEFSSFAAPSKPNLKPCLLKPIIDDVVKLFHLSYPSIKIEYKDTSDSLLLDADKIKRVLINLITNSIEAFKSSACPNPTIAIQATREQTSTRITVSDNGPGIAPEVIDKLFLPYISTGKKNMGLGLAITQEIIMQHGGQINVAQEGPGAIFIIELPNKIDTYES